MATPAKLPSKLKATVIDFDLDENRKAHKTDVFDITGAIFRRGQPFTIRIEFDAEYDPEKHKVHVIFTIGTKSVVSKGTYLRIPVDGKSFVGGWTAETVKEKEADEEAPENCISVKITSPADALVGIYKVYVETQIENHPRYLYRYESDMFLLFNPWCENDCCYMEKEEDVNEYVLNQTGIIYLGSENKVVHRNWYYGQFERSCLETALWLIEKVNLPYENLSNPCLISRALAAMVNGADRGILESHVGGMGAGGILPQEWPGSVSIIKRFLNQKGVTVKYGDCWTFAAILCTLCRAIGIPCRVVTCFKSGHDTDNNGLIDIHWNKNHKPMRNINNDTVWVFHTWNELWFRRLDIPAEFNGWEAIDCTPNAGSESLYRLGPCPVKAIQNNQISVLYDTPYIAALANGYIVHWEVDANGEMTPINFVENALGVQILTKGPGDADPLNITEDYKCKTDILGITPSLVERKNTIMNQIQSKQKEHDVEIKVAAPAETNIGDTIVFQVTLENKSDEKRTAEMYMSSFYENYKSHIEFPCKEIKGETVVINPKSSKQHSLKIRAEDYTDRFNPSFYLKAYIQVYIKETSQVFATENDVGFDAYNVLKVITPEKPIPAEKPFDLVIQIENPIKRPLQNCILHIEGTGVAKSIALMRPIRPEETVIYRSRLMPSKFGTSTYFVTMKSNILCSEAVGTVNVAKDVSAAHSTTSSEDEN